jgi:hypothetical protein
MPGDDIYDGPRTWRRGGMAVAEKVMHLPFRASLTLPALRAFDCLAAAMRSSRAGGLTQPLPGHARATSRDEN